MLFFARGVLCPREEDPCRCGGGFEVMADELHQDFDHVDLPCFNCSLHVRVTYGCE